MSAWICSAFFAGGVPQPHLGDLAREGMALAVVAKRADIEVVIRVVVDVPRKLRRRARA